jgi:hypothetical protein
MSFCVIYDLTEQQRKEKELRDLEKGAANEQDQELYKSDAAALFVQRSGLHTGDHA